MALQEKWLEVGVWTLEWLNVGRDLTDDFGTWLAPINRETLPNSSLNRTSAHLFEHLVGARAPKVVHKAFSIVQFKDAVAYILLRRT